MFYTLTKDQRDLRKKDKKTNQVNCPSCPASLQGLLKKKAFCIFCLNYVCKSHIVKKRKDPLAEDQIGKICRDCEDELLRQKIMSKHKKKEYELQEQDKEVSNILNNVNTQFQDLLSKEQTIKYLIEKDQKEYEKKDQQIRQNIMQADERQEQLNQESLKLSEQYRNLIEQKQAEERQKQLLQDKLQKLQSQEQEIQNQNQQTLDQIENVKDNISKLTSQINKMTNNRHDKEKEKTSLHSLYSTSNIGTLHITSEIEPRPRPSKVRKQITDAPDRERGSAYCCVQVFSSKPKKKNQ